MSPERDGGNQLGCKLNGKLTLINFENFEQSNGIRVELIKELDDSEVFEEKRRQLATLQSSGLFPNGNSPPKFK